MTQFPPPLSFCCPHVRDTRGTQGVTAPVIWDYFFEDNPKRPKSALEKINDPLNGPNQPDRPGPTNKRSGVCPKSPRKGVMRTPPSPPSFDPLLTVLAPGVTQAWCNRLVGLICRPNNCLVPYSPPLDPLGPLGQTR